MNDFSRRIASLSPEKRAALKAILSRERTERRGATTITANTKRAIGVGLPVSFAQARLWFLDQYEPDSAFYNIPLAFRIAGDLDVTALCAALDELIRRHEALRTGFAVVDQEPVQLIHAAGQFKLGRIDLAHLSAAQREAEAARLVSEEAASPFDLAANHLIRARLIRLDQAEHVLVINLHHIVGDGWSLGVLRRELSLLYASYTRNLPSPLPELPIQYADYAIWQRNWLQGEVLDSQLAYWKARLDRAPPLLELPTSKPRPSLQGFKGAQQLRLLDKALLDGLKAQSGAQRVTLFMTLLAAFQVLLARYTRSNDIVVGSPIAGRTRAETENLIGFFVNTLVLRTDCSGDPSFIELLSRVRETCLSAYAHQDIPFEKLVEELKPERSLSYSPIFQVMFALQNAGAEPLQLEGLAVGRLTLDRKAAKFDLNMAATETAEGLALSVEYNIDLFDGPTIARLIGHYETLLRGVVANPGRKLSALPLLTDGERRTLLVEWNQTQTDYPQDKTIQALFEDQVKLTPDQVALVFEERTLTYAELNLRANQLAHHLIALGAGPEVLVGLCVERSPEMIVALIAILKAGAAYLPLDLNYPRDRLAFMLRDAEATILITEPHLQERLPEHGAPAVLIGGNRYNSDSRYGSDAWAGCPGTNPNPRTTPDSLAYVIYTSGSTGRPKGVSIPHRGVVSLLSWAHRTFGADLSGVLAATSICFDLSVFEIFAPLTCGGAVVLAQDILQLPQLPASGKVTLLNTVPSAIAGLLDANGIADSVRTVNLGGEPLLTALVERLYRENNVRRVFDLYGPTETTIYSTFALRRQSDFATIGRPLANTEVYILDFQLNPVPIGVAGELHIGGAGLAHGYLKRPELTAEKFISNPFSRDAHARLYKTGDLARYLADGNIEFLGRIDRQVKLRGFRIELGEIEAVLTQYPNVRQAAVIVTEDCPDDKRLVAYVVGAVPSADGKAALAHSELRAYLKQRLPDHMLPSAFVMLDALPLTPNGKLDRKALPMPDRPVSETSFVSPRTPIEHALVEIWAKVLKLERIGINDNFFASGGHSLLATQVISRARQVFQIELPLRALFEAPTVAELALAIADKNRLEAATQDEVARMLAEVEALSDTEAQLQLALYDNSIT